MKTRDAGAIRLLSGRLRGSSDFEWKTHYRGVLNIAYLDGVAIAGLSGPWADDQYTLIWWDHRVPWGTSEIFASPEAARRRVDEWVRTFSERSVEYAANDALGDDADPARPGWTDRIRRLLDSLPRSKGKRRPARALSHVELASMHFRATD